MGKRSRTQRFLLAVALFLASGIAFADLPVAPIDESSLPYGLSPSNYDNAPSNYDNSISNYDNSPSNYDNSESNYNNSTSIYDNGHMWLSNRRLLKDSGTVKFAQLLHFRQHGVTNFFSPSGKRMFYNPKKGRAIFGGRDGTFARWPGKMAVCSRSRGVA